MKTRAWMIAVAFLVAPGSLALASGEYDGTYALEYGESKVFLDCAISNFDGDLEVATPLYVSVPAGELFPEEVIEEMLALAYERILEYQLDPYPEYRALSFADTFYEELQRAIDDQLAIYPDQLGVAADESAELPTPYFYVFDATLVDQDTGWEAAWLGGMRTLAGAYALYPYFDHAIDVSLDTTILGISVGIQMA